MGSEETNLTFEAMISMRNVAVELMNFLARVIAIFKEQGEDFDPSATELEILIHATIAQLSVNKEMRTFIKLASDDTDSPFAEFINQMMEDNDDR